MANSKEKGESFCRNFSEVMSGVNRLDETWMYSSLTIKELSKTSQLQEMLASGNEGNSPIFFHACAEDDLFVAAYIIYKSRVIE
jgi:hypothetical protein